MTHSIGSSVPGLVAESCTRPAFPARLEDLFRDDVMKKRVLSAIFVSFSFLAADAASCCANEEGISDGASPLLTIDTSSLFELLEKSPAVTVAKLLYVWPVPARQTIPVAQFTFDALHRSVETSRRRTVEQLRRSPSLQLTSQTADSIATASSIDFEVKSHFLPDLSWNPALGCGLLPQLQDSRPWIARNLQQSDRDRLTTQLQDVLAAVLQAEATTTYDPDARSHKWAVRVIDDLDDSGQTADEHTMLYRLDAIRSALLSGIQTGVAALDWTSFTDVNKFLTEFPSMLVPVSTSSPAVLAIPYHLVGRPGPAELRDIDAQVEVLGALSIVTPSEWLILDTELPIAQVPAISGKALLEIYGRLGVESSSANFLQLLTWAKANPQGDLLGFGAGLTFALYEAGRLKATSKNADAEWHEMISTLAHFLNEKGMLGRVRYGYAATIAAATTVAASAGVYEAWAYDISKRIYSADHVISTTVDKSTLQAREEAFASLVAREIGARYAHATFDSVKFYEAIAPVRFIEALADAEEPGDWIVRSALLSLTRDSGATASLLSRNLNAHIATPDEATAECQRALDSFHSEFANFDYDVPVETRLRKMLSAYTSQGRDTN